MFVFDVRTQLNLISPIAYGRLEEELLHGKLLVGLFPTLSSQPLLIADFFELCPSIEECLTFGFVLETSKYGEKYWLDIVEKYKAYQRKELSLSTEVLVAKLGEASRNPEKAKLQSSVDKLLASLLNKGEDLTFLLNSVVKAPSLVVSVLRSSQLPISSLYPYKDLFLAYYHEKP